jgi:YidC/Oxa1 family membrane protein insertase
MSDNRNPIIAVLLSLAIFGAWEYFIGAPKMKADQAHQAQIALQHKQAQSAPQAAAAAAPAAQHLSRGAALKQGGARIAIDTPSVDGSLLLKGAHLDDLRLKRFRDTVDPKSPEIVLFSPQSSPYPYYAVFGFVDAPGQKAAVPDGSTPWTQQGTGALTPSHPVTLTWDNGHGLVFTRVIAVDDKFLFTVTDSVANKSNAAVALQPFAYVARDGVPPSQHYWVLHEGFVGYAGSLKDPSYDDFKDDTPPKQFDATGGWLGITDKYWMAALIPPQDQHFDGTYSAQPGAAKHFQADYRLGVRTIGAGAATSVTHRLFAGAKVYDTLSTYKKKFDISNFDYAIDWGWFWFFTQPLFWLLDHLYQLLGNFGIAILALTVVVKLIFFPIANAQFKSMAKMKKVQPQMERIKERFADDPQKQQQAMMELYRTEKVNPVAGCLPMLLIIPVFFSLYKVIFVTLELRHAPFYGWIHDLSAPDPTSLVNLFGLLPFDPHAVLPSFLGFLSIGIWPILMGITQWFQTKLNPAPADPMQARMFAFMPLIFTFMFATFPAGLVIYYTWNNLLTVIQQYVIMRRQGADVHLIDNLKSPAWLNKLIGRSDDSKDDK